MPVEPSQVPVPQPYELSEHQKGWVRDFAKKSHDVCNGTGVTGWMNQGQTACLCSCVQKELKRLESSLERMRIKLMAQLEEKYIDELEAEPSRVPQVTSR